MFTHFGMVFMSYTVRAAHFGFQWWLHFLNLLKLLSKQSKCWFWLVQSYLWKIKAVASQNTCLSIDMGAAIESEEPRILKAEEGCMHPRRKCHMIISQHPWFHSLEESNQRAKPRSHNCSQVMRKIPEQRESQKKWLQTCFQTLPKGYMPRTLL